MFYFEQINSFLVWDASLLATVSSSQCLDLTGGKIENGLERGFVNRRLNYLLITDPRGFLSCKISKGLGFFSYHIMPGPLQRNSIPEKSYGNFFKGVVSKVVI